MGEAKEKNNEANKKLEKYEIKKNTNGWDFLISLFNSVFNLKLSKIGALFLLWFLIRDVIFVIKLPKDYSFGDNLIDEIKMIERIMQNESLPWVIVIAVIIVLVLIIVLLVGYIRIIRKEIGSIAEVRKELMHGLKDGNLSHIKNHVSTIN